jgi:hypothetical protein
MWEPRRLTTLWTFMARYRDNFIFFNHPHCIMVAVEASNHTFRDSLSVKFTGNNLKDWYLRRVY